VKSELSKKRADLPVGHPTGESVAVSL